MSAEQFHKLTLGNPPRELAKRILPILNTDSLILDCGCGAGSDTLLFISQGHKVIALDNKTSMLRERIKGLAYIKDEVIIKETDIINFKIPRIDCFYSSLTLSFLPKKDFYNLWNKLIAELNRGTIIAINIFGNRDEWYQDTEDMTFMDESEFRALISDLKVLHYLESERYGTSMGRDGLPMKKKWHVFECILKV